MASTGPLLQLTNVSRRFDSPAGAGALAILDGVSLEVKDEGKGISPEKLAEIQSRGGGVGIKGMRERVRQLGGNIDIRSGEEGTQVIARFPLNPSAEEYSDSVQTAS